jgi:hypothetical protein
MGGLRNILRAVPCLALLAGALSLRAEPLPALPQLAACTGRLSALMEHQFLADGPASETTRRHRDGLADILAAVTPAGAEIRVMAWRVEAKAAHAALLRQARFGPDPDRRAALRADRLIAACTGFLLS